MRWLLLLLLPGCTAVKSTYALVDAQRALQDARDAGADTRAIYQYTLAEAYLQKAREENGYADYGAADQLCRKAKAASAQAIEDAESGATGPNAEELPENLQAVPERDGERDSDPEQPFEEDP